MKNANKKLEEWLTDDKLMLLSSWARDGVQVRDMCNRIDISTATFYKWQEECPEIKEALRCGKEIVDYKVENALLKAALGHTTTEIKVTIGKRMINGEAYMITKETTTKEVAPNVTACLAWLNNRLPDKWKRNRDKSFEEEVEDSNLKVTIIRGPQNDENESEDNINKEIKIEKNNSTSVNLVNQEDKDYWPDDWEDDE